MYPLTKPELTFEEVAKHWGRQIPNPRAEDEVFDLMSRGFWRGELTLRDRETGLPRDHRDALETLRAMTALAEVGDWTHDIEPAPSMLEFCSEKPPDLLDLWCEDPEGALRREQSPKRHRIHLPKKPEDWTPSIVREALETTARIEYRDFPIYWYFWLLISRVRRDEFAAFCALHGYAEPAWWAAPKPPGDRGKPKRPLRGAARGHDDRERAIASVVARYQERGVPKTKKEVGNDLLRELERLGPSNAKRPARSTLDYWADEVRRLLK